MVDNWMHQQSRLMAEGIKKRAEGYLFAYEYGKLIGRNQDWVKRNVKPDLVLKDKNGRILRLYLKKP